MANVLKIYKYQLEITDRQTLKLPFGAKILSVETQTSGGITDTRIVLYALVDPDAIVEERIFIIHGTGHPMEPQEINYPFIGTVSVGGVLMFHVFEEKEGN